MYAGDPAEGFLAGVPVVEAIEGAEEEEGQGNEPEQWAEAGELGVLCQPGAAEANQEQGQEAKQQVETQGEGEYGKRFFGTAG